MEFPHITGISPDGDGLLGPSHYDTWSPSRCSSGGGLDTVISGTGAFQRSISTRTCWPVQPWARLDVPWSIVNTLGFPCTHSASTSVGSSGSYQAPVES